MTFKDKIERFHRFALTCSTGIYNEDSMTAQQLNIASANKIKEFLLMVDDLATGIANIKDFLKIGYDDMAEELELTIGQKVEELKEQVNSSYVSIFNEDARTNLELAGCTARAVNECVKAVNMLSDLVVEINDFIALNYVPDQQMLVIGGAE